MNMAEWEHAGAEMSYYGMKIYGKAVDGVISTDRYLRLKKTLDAWKSRLNRRRPRK